MINFTKEEKQYFINEIQRYFEEERGEQLGIIGAEDVLEFFTENIGKKMYNKGVDDTKL